MSNQETKPSALFLWPSCQLLSPVTKGLWLAHYLGDSLVSLAFPGRYRVFFVPGHEQSLLLLAHLQVIAVEDVEVSSSDLTSYLWPWLNSSSLEVHLKVALTIDTRFTFEHPVPVVTAVSVGLTNG